MVKMMPESGHAPARKRDVAQLAEKLRLPFQSRSWRGTTGAWQGRNQGSSIDFQDHRSYVPGDDPRHLDWAAYARTNHYVMKLFREEVSPRLDLVLDASASMAMTPEKEERALDLFALALQSALLDGVSVRAYVAHSAGHCRRLEMPAARALEQLPTFDAPAEKATRIPLGEIAWRPGSLRVLVSDLLVPQPPERELALLGQTSGRAVILAPYLRDEAEPDWNGNLEMRDCETRRVRQQRVEPFLLLRYQDNYRRHFELWKQEARRRGAIFARISCEGPLVDAVRRQALPEGAFEARH
jgi:uncharacterized protein (DUF58 family)